MRKFFGKLTNDILGLFFIGMTVFLLMILTSYSPQDPSLNNIVGHLRAKNWGGILGSSIADLCFQFLGVGSWMLPFLTLWKGIQNLRQKSIEALEMVLCLLTTWALATVVALHLPQWQIFSQLPAGGILGSMTSAGLVFVLNRPGASLLVWTIVAMAGLLLVRRPISELKNIVRSPLEQAINWFKSNTLGHGLTAAPISIIEPTQIQEIEIQEPENLEKLESFKIESRKDGLLKPSPAKQNKVERRIANWELPKLDLLQGPPVVRTGVDKKTIERNVRVLTDKLAQFSVRGEVVAVKPGPAVTMYEFKPAADVKLSKITELADDLALALSAESLRILAPVPGRDVVGIESSNSSRETVYLREALEETKFWDEKLKLPIALGKQADGAPRVEDLRKMPHLLVAGSTGSGKSVFVLSVITSLIFRHSPKTLRLILIDPKQVDLAVFYKIPHLLMPPVKEAKPAVGALKWAIREMEKRYRSLSKFDARGLEAFNEAVSKLDSKQIEEHQLKQNEMGPHAELDGYYFQELPYIVIVVEEFGDLMTTDKVNVEQAVLRLAQKARACGIHLILATQSPRKDVVTGLIKTNIPGRISFKVASKTDSRIILDDGGAERLLPGGDMLYLAPGVSKPQRHHGAWIPEAEVSAISKFWSDQGEPEFELSAMRLAQQNSESISDTSGGDESGSDGDLDDKYDEVLGWLSTQKEASASLLQRRFHLGYPRAARMIEILEREGVVGPANGSKPRQVLLGRNPA